MALSFSNNKNITSLSEDDMQLVEHQLLKILNSQYFKSAHQIQKFLAYVVHKTIAGQQQKLKQYTIAVEGLELPTNFDSDNNPVIRIIAGRVREKLKKYYDKEGENDPLVISVPKGSYIPSFAKKGRTQISPDTKDGVSCGPTLALVCFSDKTQNRTSNRLLFQMTDTLAKEFSNFLFSRLVVSIPNADISESNAVIQTMKNKYDADFTLVLHIHQLPQDKFELFYRLLDTETSEVICSESFDIDSQQAISKQTHIIGKITATVADILQGNLHIHWSRKLLESNQPIPKQYQTLAYYRHYTDNLSREAFAKSVQICEQALNRNPEDIVANVVFADYCRRDYVYGYKIIPSPMQKGKQAAETAVNLKPDSHEGHFALAQILFCTKEWKDSLREFDQARHISKFHVGVEYGTGFHLCMMGDWEKGMNLVNKAMALSNTYPTWFHLVPFLYYYRQGRYQEALGEARKIVAQNLIHGPMARCVGYAKIGDMEKSHLEYEETLRRFPYLTQNGETMLKRFFGDEELANTVWLDIIQIAKSYESSASNADVNS